MSIEDDFDITLVASLALKEKQIQQNYRPIIAVHKWFARRPGTLFRGLILSEFGERPLATAFFEGNNFAGRVVADPFMGGGTPLIEANRVGCDVLGFDINPMAAWIVREEIEHLDVGAYRAAAGQLAESLEQELGHIYRTDCPRYGDRDVPVKYFLWVKVIDCDRCEKSIDLFPGYLLADDSRHCANVLVCHSCGDLNEVADLKNPGQCSGCGAGLVLVGPARKGRCACAGCGHNNAYARPDLGPPRHRLVAIEYFNPARRDRHDGRFFKKPDGKDLERVQWAVQRWRSLTPEFVPEQEILNGDETDRLHRWGYRLYRELFNERQLLGLEMSCRLIAGTDDRRLRYALATNLSDLLRYQNMLCRYDTTALKSLDIFSVHGFPVGLVQCESNLIGTVNGKGINVGSGGWMNVIEKYARAKSYCSAPFEVRKQGRHKVTVPIPGEWIGERKNGAGTRSATLRCSSSTTLTLEPTSLDAVFTDPPYFGNVQYGELMDFCYVWLRRLVGTEPEGFGRPSSRSANELTGNATQARGLDHFADGLSAVYQSMARALKPGAPLAFTFHHNRPEPYHAVGVAVLDAGLTCVATLPCPAEMGGSIHIHGTGSSIVDTIFVCRGDGRTRQGQSFESLDQLAQVMEGELGQLRNAGMKPTAGDIRCMVYGHLTRYAIERLRKGWDPSRPTAERLDRVAKTEMRLGDCQALIDGLAARASASTGIARSVQLAFFPQDDRDGAAL
jgi:adenine-specific DNA methylase